MPRERLNSEARRARRRRRARADVSTPELAACAVAEAWFRANGMKMSTILSQAHRTRSRRRCAQQKEHRHVDISSARRYRALRFPAVDGVDARQTARHSPRAGEKTENRMLMKIPLSFYEPAARAVSRASDECRAISSSPRRQPSEAREVVAQRKNSRRSEAGFAGRRRQRFDGLHSAQSCHMAASI